MSTESIHELTKQRLEKYEVFSDTTCKLVAAFAQKQSKYKTYQAFFEAVGMPAPQLYVNKKGEGVSVVDIASQSSKSSQGTIVIHLPMSNPLDANQLYHVATVAATNPHYRVIAFGNPSGEPFSYKEQNLNFWKRIGIGTLRHLRPLVSAEIDYLKEQKIATMHLVGYSYGAHKALIETSYLKPGVVKSLVLIDPVAHPRGMKQLTEDFRRTFQPLGGYVNRTEMQTYFDARAEAAKTKHHKEALARSITIAIGFMMARFNVVPFLTKVISRHPHLQVSVAWGSDSELGNDAHVSTSLAQLSRDTPGMVRAMRLEADTHAFANDIYLYAAIIHEGLIKTKK